MKQRTESKRLKATKKWFKYYWGLILLIFGVVGVLIGLGHLIMSCPSGRDKAISNQKRLVKNYLVSRYDCPRNKIKVRRESKTPDHFFFQAEVCGVRKRIRCERVKRFGLTSCKPAKKRKNPKED